MPTRTLNPLLALALLLSGCAPIGVLGHKIVGPPPIKPQYVPAKEPMLVLVENYHNPSAAMLDAQRLALHTTAELHRCNIAPLVSPDRLEAVRSDPAYAKMTIPAVGRAAGHKQVLYIHVRHFTIENTVGGEMFKGKADLTVRIVDTATGQTRWPTASPTGHPITLDTPWQPQGDGATDATLRAQMTQQAATAIVKLFRKYSPEETGAGE